jgi:hypothetical protein
MSRDIRRAFRATLPPVLAPVPKAEWPPYPPGTSAPPIEVWRSRDYIVQVYADPTMTVMERISVQRADGKDGLTWDDLMNVKRQIGRGDQPCVEYFPPDAQVVNVAKMRHLWVLPHVPAWAWKPSQTNQGAK